MKIGIDLDGVVYPFAESLAEYLRHAHDLENFPPPQRWEFYEDWGFSFEEFRDYCDWGVDAGVIFTWGEPLPGAWDGIAELITHGHTIHLVTNRRFGKRSAEATEQWLHDQQIPYHSLTFSPDKTLVDVDIFLDDYLGNYDELVAAGIHAVLFDQPWNREREDANRVSDWADFVRHVKLVDLLKSALPVEEATILDEAKKLVHGNRGVDYGHPADDFARTGRIWGAILGTPDVPPELVGLCMVGVKISREVNRPKRDNRVDGAGYFETVDMIQSKRN